MVNASATDEQALIVQSNINLAFPKQEQILTCFEVEVLPDERGCLVLKYLRFGSALALPGARARGGLMRDGLERLME